MSRLHSVSPEYFPEWDWNRMTHPDRHVVVCEDDLGQQARASGKMRDLYGAQGRVQISLVPGAIQAAAAMSVSKRVDAVLLDHDMPEGNGQSLINWMAGNGFLNTPIVSFSGIPQNNTNMNTLAIAHGFTNFHVFTKEEVLGGLADAILQKIVGI